VVSVRPTVKQYGKTLTFVGVLFLVVGLLQGGAGASTGGNGNGAGHEHAAGWQRNFGDQPSDTVAGDAAATVTDPACGAYCSTTDGTPSANGNGGGNGNQPCAGCVGNADNQNPPGQYRDGSDHNNGYECDGNNGVAKGNPAHSGCDETTTTVPHNTTTTVPHNTTTTVAQGTTTTTVASTTTTVAAGGTTTTTAEVLGVQFTRGVDPLASTGAGFLRPFTLLGALLLLLGVALMTIKVRPLAAV
jgi:hypothetical protein